MRTHRWFRTTRIYQYSLQTNLLVRMSVLTVTMVLKSPGTLQPISAFMSTMTKRTSCTGSKKGCSEISCAAITQDRWQKKVELLTGAKWSYAIMNEHMQIISWVFVESDAERHLATCWEGLRERYQKGKMPSATLQWVDKDCCTAPPYTVAETSSNAVPEPNELATFIDRKPFWRNSVCRPYYNADI